jgi:acyl-CoA synthetase (AMP-forming)/AMP-acid ligase II
MTAAPLTRAEVSHLAAPVEHWARARPDEVALVFEGREWTWAQWAERVRRVAGGLTAAGVRRGDRVAFLDRNHPACLEVTLGAASIGAANAVINWRLAGDELDYVINDSGARILFVGAELRPLLDGIRDRLTGVERIVTVGGGDDAYEDWLARATPRPPAGDLTADEVCLVMYSSGTTGRPKGVMLTHRALIAHTINVSVLFDLGPGDVNLVAMPLFHVGGTSYALFGIYAGVRSVMTRAPDAPSLLGALRAGVTHAFLVPAVVSAILDAGEEAIAAFAALKYLAYGASPMALPVLRRALAAWPDTAFVQVYGMTELCGVISALRPAAHRAGTRHERLGSAGTLVAGAEMRIVDPETGEDAPTGELWFRSAQAMAGYLNQPEATAETLSDEGWLRSGDVGRTDEDGFIFIEDRVKDMIITGGENVYSPEVERVIFEHPAVADAAIIGVPDEHWGESIKAVVVAAGGHQLRGEELIAHCREHLAGYKCPRSVDIVEDLPRSPTGKVLKKVLREPHWAGRERQV